MEQTGLVGFFSILSRPSQLLTFSPSLDEGFIKNYNRNRKTKGNPCGKLVFVEYLLSLRASAHTGVAIPQLNGIR